ncbi:hypothetical protein [Pseudomonas gozinkensis]|uniref:hypothetical protein n=1 Tax=Pseudomonas gozinkensis TaxID=2774461 RepID=UPI001787BCF8|nr:hypothetical protein [Pseudomonas gozinkensis]
MHSVGASLLAMAAYEPTNLLQVACNPCGSWLASDGGLTADLFLADCMQSLWELAASDGGLAADQFLAECM